jgi:hypothetical protein
MWLNETEAHAPPRIRHDPGDYFGDTRPETAKPRERACKLSRRFATTWPFITSPAGSEEQCMANSRSGAGWRQRSTGFLAGVAAIVLIVVLLGGMAIGYEIEKSRVKSPATSAAKKAASPKHPASVRVVGTVSQASATSISITPTTGAIRKFAVLKGTVVAKAGAGAASDIAPNVKVVFDGGGSFLKAKTVIVLPNTARVGTMVTAADANSMSIKSGTKVLKVTTTGATINKVSPAKIADLVKGSKVFVGGVRTKAGALIATEIILLPTGSSFA